MRGVETMPDRMQRWVSLCERLLAPEHVRWIDSETAQPLIVTHEQFAPSGSLSPSWKVGEETLRTRRQVRLKDMAAGELELAGALRRRTMYVVPFIVPPAPGRALTIGVEVTDSPGVVSTLLRGSVVDREPVESLARNHVIEARLTLAFPPVRLLCRMTERFPDGEPSLQESLHGPCGHREKHLGLRMADPAHQMPCSVCRRVCPNKETAAEP